MKDLHRYANNIFFFLMNKKFITLFREDGIIRREWRI